MSKDESKKSSEPTAPESQNPDDSTTPDTNNEIIPAAGNLTGADQFFSMPPVDFDGIVAGVEIHAEHRTRTVTGPIPPPEVMKVYGEVDSSFPERIMAQFEKESTHRRDLQRGASAANIRDMHEERIEKRTGQLLGVIGMFAMLGAAVWVTLAGHSGVGGGLVAALVAAITVLVTGKPFRATKNIENDEDA